MSRLPSTRRGRRIFKTASCAATLGALVFASLAPVSVRAVTPMVVKRGPYTLAPGVELLSIHYSTPNELRVVTITPAPNPATVEVGTPSANFGSYKKPSQIGQDAGAVVAVNGDYNQDGGPAHFNAIDADLRTTGIMEGTGFALAKDEVNAYARRPDEVVNTTTKRAGILVNSFKVDRWNAGDPSGGEIAAFTPVGNNAYKAPDSVCSAVLRDPTAPKWSSVGKAAVSRTYTVDHQDSPCPTSAPTFGPNGKVILTARKASSAASALVKALEPGDKVTITWKATGWPGVVDVIGGQPLLVDAGINVGPPSTAGASYFYKNNPRTGVGITEGCVPDHSGVCKVIIMTVDGRRASTWSSGMTLKAFAAEFIKQGAYYAINLDGGGGTVMWVDPPGPAADFGPCITIVGSGCLVNKPGDSAGERSAVSALLVLPDPDPDEPGMGSALLTSPAVASSAFEPSSFLLSAADPGSIGGLVDAVAEGGFGPVPADPAFERILSLYRTADPS